MEDETPTGQVSGGTGTGHSTSRRVERVRRSRASRWRRRVVWSLASLLVAIPIIGGAGWWYVNYRLDQAHRVSIAKGLLGASRPGAPFNILLIGSDSRQGESSSDAAHFGSATAVSGQRSDVLIVARFVPATRQVYLLSIPRDTYVDIPGDTQYISGENRINAAYNNGPGLLIETLKRDLGIPITHYAAINFSGFQNMVSAVGGIRIDFPDKLHDPYSGLSIDHTGCQLLAGPMALAYVRSRHLSYYSGGQWHYDGMSDWSRIRRQDVFFHALLTQVKARVTDPIAMNDLLVAVVHNLTLDSTMSNSFLINLGVDFRHISESSIHTEVLPTIPETLPDGADVLEQAQPYDASMIRAFLAEGTRAAQKPAPSPSSAPNGKGAGGATTSTSTTTTTPSAPSNVVFDTFPEPWNGTPC